MRHWPHVAPTELFPTPFAREFASPRMNALRQRLLNFELAPEPSFSSAEATPKRVAH